MSARKRNAIGVAPAAIVRAVLLLGVSQALTCAWSAAGEDAALEKWPLKHSCFQLQLQQSRLTVRRPSGFWSSGGCRPDEEDKERTRKAMPESIPLDSITDIIREVVTRRPVQDEIDESMTSIKPENLLSTIGEAAEAGPFAPAAPVVVLAVVGAMEPFHGVRTHVESVRILWTADGTPRSTNFTLSRKGVESLVRRLAQATGKSAKEVRFDSKAPDQQSTQLLVSLAEPVSVGDVSVWGGRYRLLMIGGSDATRLVYLFSEHRQMPQDALAVFAGESSPLGTEKPWKVKLVRDADASWCLSEIHTEVERLQVRACHGQPPPEERRKSNQELLPPAVTILPAGEPVPVLLLQGLNTHKSMTVESVPFQVTNNVRVGDFTVIAKGTNATGKAFITSPDGFTRKAQIYLVLGSTSAVTGTEIPLSGIINKTGGAYCIADLDCLGEGGHAAVGEDTEIEAFVAENVPLSNPMLEAYALERRRIAGHAIADPQLRMRLHIYLLPARGAAQTQVFFDGRKIVNLRPGEHLTLVPLPGKHVVAVNKDSLALELAPHDQYYVRVFQTGSWPKTKAYLKLVAPDVGQDYVTDMVGVPTNEH